MAGTTTTQAPRTVRTVGVALPTVLIAAVGSATALALVLTGGIAVGGLDGAAGPPAGSGHGVLRGVAAPDGVAAPPRARPGPASPPARTSPPSAPARTAPASVPSPPAVAAPRAPGPPTPTTRPTTRPTSGPTSGPTTRPTSGPTTRPTTPSARPTTPTSRPSAGPSAGPARPPVVDCAERPGRAPVCRVLDPVREQLDRPRRVVCAVPLGPDGGCRAPVVATPTGRSGDPTG